MKKTIARYSILLILLFTVLIPFSQNNEKIDLLRNKIARSKTDTSKVNMMIELGWEYFNYDFVLATNISIEAVSESKKIKYIKGEIEATNLLGNIYSYRAVFDSALINFNKNIILCKKHGERQLLSNTYNNMAIVFETMGHMDSSLYYYEKTLAIDQELGNKKNLSGTYFGMGNTYCSMGIYKTALENYFKALKIKEEIGDNAGLSELYISIGKLYYHQKKYKNALSYYKKSEKIKLKLNDKYGLSGNYINQGTAYSDLNDSAKAFDYFNKALEIAIEMNNEYYMGMIYNNISRLYYNAGDMNKSLETAQKGLALREKIGDLPGIASCLVNLGSLLKETGRKSDALAALERAYKLGVEVESYEIKKAASEALSMIYAESGDYKNAYKYHLIFKQSCDSLQNEENTRRTTELEMQYKFDKKEQKAKFEQEQKDILADAELEQQKLYRNSFIAGFSLMVILAVVIFRNYRRKRKDNILLTWQKHEIEEKNEELNQQNEEIKSQRDEIEVQKNYIEGIHSELKDSIKYAERIQKAVLLDEQTLSEKIGNEFFVFFRPKDIVSGDFYFVEKRKNMLLLAVADCTGHGVPGAFMSMLGISFLTEIIAKEDVWSAGHVLDELRRYVINSLQQKGIHGEQKDGMDIVFVALNTETLELQFAGANNSLVVMKKHDDTGNYECHEIKGDKMPVAIHLKLNDFTNHQLQLNKGDVIYLMSDGFQDQFGGPEPGGKKFLAKNMKKLLCEICSDPMPRQKETLDKTLESWKNAAPAKYEQTDDITVFGVKVV